MGNARHLGEICVFYAVLALVDIVVIGIVDLVTGLCISDLVGLVVKVVRRGIIGIRSCPRAVDVGREGVLVHIERGHIDGLAAQLPIPELGQLGIVLRLILVVVDSPFALVGSGLALYNGYGGTGGVFTGRLAHLHVVGESHAGINRRAAALRGEVLHVNIFIRAVEVIVQAGAGIHRGSRHILRLLTDALPCEGTGQRQHHCHGQRNAGGQKFLFHGILSFLKFTCRGNAGWLLGQVVPEGGANADIRNAAIVGSDLASVVDAGDSDGIEAR